MNLVDNSLLNNSCIIWILIFKAEELKVAAQLRGDVLPLSHTITFDEPRQVTDAERKVEIFRLLRKERADKKYRGKREKRAREAAEENK